MTFGLCNATATLQRPMSQALKKLTKKCGILIIGYVYDVVIAMPILQDHSECLDKVFACMKRVALKCRSKCEILKDSMKYRERMVDKYGIRPDHDAAEAIPSVEISKNRAPVDEFSWFCKLLKGYYYQRLR